MFNSILPYAIAHTILKVIHQITRFYVKHLVKGTGNMEAHSIHVVVFHILSHLFSREPTLVAKTELNLIPIHLRLRRAYDGCRFRQSHLTDTRQVIYHLFLLIKQLTFVT